MVDYMPVRSLKPGQKDLYLMCIILEIGRRNVTKEGHEVRTVKVADKSGSVNLSVWDEPGKLISCGDIVKLSRVYTNVWKNCLTLYIAKGGGLSKVGDFCLVFKERPFLSEPNPDLASLRAQIRSERHKMYSSGKMYSSSSRDSKSSKYSSPRRSSPRSDYRSDSRKRRRSDSRSRHSSHRHRK